MAAPVPRDRSRPAPAARASRPELRVVERRRRWPAVIGGLLIVLLLGGMMGLAVFHTQLAQRQLEIDRLDRAVDAERERFDELRRDRATMRSPGRIAEEAVRLGMVRGEASEFAEVDAAAVARQIAAAGAADADPIRIIDDADPLDQFRDVKAVSAGQP